MHETLHLLNGHNTDAISLEVITAYVCVETTFRK